MSHWGGALTTMCYCVYIHITCISGLGWAWVGAWVGEDGVGVAVVSRTEVG